MAANRKCGITSFKCTIPRKARRVVDSLDAVFREFEISAAVTQSPGNHLVASFDAGGRPGKVFASLSPSDHRAPMRAASELRRKIREMLTR